MNRRQKTILVVGISIAAMMVLYPPFILTGGIFPDFKYSFIWSPPPGSTDGEDYQIFVFWPLVIFQIILVSFVTLLLYRAHGNRTLAVV